MSANINSPLSRREWLKLSSAGVVSYSLSGWLGRLAADSENQPQRKRACILLWMNGGPTQTDTFDMKPGHANGGTFKPIKTTVAGIEISEHLPKIAQQMKHLSILRPMTTKEGDHTRATSYMRTGYLPQGPIHYPPLGALVSKELGDENAALPNFVSIAPFSFFAPAAYGSGFLGPQYAPLTVGSANAFNGNRVNYEKALKVEDLARPGSIGKEHHDARMTLLGEVSHEFSERHPGVATSSHKSAYERAARLMKTDAAKAFELDSEAASLRDAYGRNMFGQGCLLARRLVERGVPFVEVTLNGVDANGFIGWDTHSNNFEMVRKLCEVLDPAWATLIQDLDQRGLLPTTTVVWMGEFGRTPKINNQGGRDHFPNAWSTVIGGGGVKGGTVFGASSKDGNEVKDNPVTVPNFVATVVKAIGLDPTKQNMSNVGRPIRLADAGAKPVKEVLA